MTHLSSFLILITVFGFLTSCQQPEEKTTRNIIEKEQLPQTAIDTETANYQFKFSSLKLHDHLREVDLRAFKHFGEFYTKDFSIYRLDRIDYLEENLFIDDINLYFIDSTLVKIQAFLREDRGNHFINRYGNAKISIDNDHNKRLLEKEKILIKKNGKYSINEKLDHYTLKWLKEDSDIFYRVNKNPDTPHVIDTVYFSHTKKKNQQFKLTIQTKDFNHQMEWVKWESYKVSRGLASSK